jgi:hypothetical protein
MLITKRAFAKRCGVSAPTVYKWIEKNRDGLQAFVRADGIDDAIFDIEPWKQYKDVDQAAAASSEITALKEENAQLKLTISTLQMQVNMLQEQKQTQDQLFKAMLATVDRQISMLPAPKKSLIELLIEDRKARREARAARKAAKEAAKNTPIITQ